MKLERLDTKELPKPLPLRKLIGPSFIILGVGLGSGELILWPYLASNYGLGIMWAALLGITFQFFINMEIERYTLATGESIFVGLKRKFGSFAPFWFIATTLTPWLWPGIIASSGTVFAKAFGITYSGTVGIVLLLLIGILFSLGRVVYKTQEQVQKAIILVGVPFIFLITLYFAQGSDWVALGEGIMGKGEGFWFLPAGIPLAAFLGALAYAGAGGNLNLAQSLYIKEKGYGMAKYSGRITTLFSGEKEDIKLEGAKFTITKENLKRFNIWWRRINIEHGIVFWLTGAFTMMMLALLAYTTVFGNAGTDRSIQFVIKESETISNLTLPALGTFFLIMTGIMLFGTQFSVYGSNARIASENLMLVNKNVFAPKNAPKFFYFFLWFQILAGILIFSLGFTEPLALVITGAVLNAISMFIYTMMIFNLNTTLLDKPLQPSLIRRIGIIGAILFYGGFSLFTVYERGCTIMNDILPQFVCIL